MTMTTTTTAMTANAAKTIRNVEREPLKFAKRIGSMSHIVSTRFNTTATETV